VVFSVELLANGATYVDSKPIAPGGSSPSSPATPDRSTPTCAPSWAENAVQQGVIGCWRAQGAGIAKIAFATSRVDPGTR
jgi:hypothetical protein